MCTKSQRMQSMSLEEAVTGNQEECMNTHDPRKIGLKVEREKNNRHCWELHSLLCSLIPRLSPAPQQDARENLGMKHAFANTLEYNQLLHDYAKDSYICQIEKDGPEG